MNEYFQGVLKTAIPCAFGFIAGMLSFILSSGSPYFQASLLILIISIAIQPAILSKIGIPFQGRDWAYISFMTSIVWFISWGAMLNI